MIDCFFYGLFMDPDVLREDGVAAENPRSAVLDGYALRLGNRATLVPDDADPGLNLARRFAA